MALFEFCLFNLTLGNFCIICGSCVEDVGYCALVSEFLSNNVLPEKLAGAINKIEIRLKITLKMQIIYLD